MLRQGLFNFYVLEDIFEDLCFALENAARNSQMIFHKSKIGFALDFISSILMINRNHKYSVCTILYFMNLKITMNIKISLYEYMISNVS